jgi:hypothetical protein
MEMIIKFLFLISLFKVTTTTTTTPFLETCSLLDLNRDIYGSEIELTPDHLCWDIKSNEKGGIRISFDHFKLNDSLNCSSDNWKNEYLQIITNESDEFKRIEFCKVNTIEPIILSSINKVSLKLKTATIDQFNYVVEVKPFTVLFDSNKGFINSPIINATHKDDVDITYEIISNNNNNRIRNNMILLQFKTLELSNDYDFLNCTSFIQISSSNFNQKICDDETVFITPFEAKHVKIRFFSFKNSAKFALHYSFISTLHSYKNNNIGHITHLKQMYGRMNISYFIEAPLDKHIEITVNKFDFGVCNIDNDLLNENQCSDNYLKVFLVINLYLLLLYIYFNKLILFSFKISMIQMN